MNRTDLYRVMADEREIVERDAEITKDKKLILIGVWAKTFRPLVNMVCQYLSDIRDHQSLEHSLFGTTVSAPTRRPHPLEENRKFHR